MIRFLLLISTLLCLSGCVLYDDNHITAEGTLLEIGITTFMYGSHKLVDDAGDLLYALESPEVDLDKYTEKEVEVLGIVYKMEHLHGPDMIDVISVQVKK